MSLVGAFKLLPVVLFAFALPLAVKPAPLLTGNFSPLPTERLGNLRLGIEPCSFFVDDESHSSRRYIICVWYGYVCPSQF